MLQDLPQRQSLWRHMYLSTRYLSRGTGVRLRRVRRPDWIDAGWQLGEFSYRSVHFFCTKIVELQTVEISPTDSGIEYYAPPFSSRMDPQ